MILIRLYYDTEFVEDGRVIDLLSIGIVREDDEMLYAIVQDQGAIFRAVNHPWLRENVATHLPIEVWDRGPDVFGYRWSWRWDEKHPDFRHVHPREEVTRLVHEFISGTPAPQLFAWYGSYDHVAYAQLFGRMIDLPDGFPMFTCDVRQEAARTCCDLRDEDNIVPRPGNAHNALHDAMWTKAAHEFLIRRERDHLASGATPLLWPDNVGVDQ